MGPPTSPSPSQIIARDLPPMVLTSYDSDYFKYAYARGFRWVEGPFLPEINDESKCIAAMTLWLMIAMDKRTEVALLLILQRFWEKGRFNRPPMIQDRRRFALKLSRWIWGGDVASWRTEDEFDQMADTVLFMWLDEKGLPLFMVPGLDYVLVDNFVDKMRQAEFADGNVFSGIYGDILPDALRMLIPESA